MFDGNTMRGVCVTEVFMNGQHCSVCYVGLAQHIGVLPGHDSFIIRTVLKDSWYVRAIG